MRSRYWSWFDTPERLTRRADDILFIGRQERLDADFETLKTLLELPPALTLPRNPRLSHKQPKGLVPELTSAQRQTLRTVVAQDDDFIAFCEARLGLAPL